jgi:hypothetical protein
MLRLILDFKHGRCVGFKVILIADFDTKGAESSQTADREVKQSL